MRSSSLLILAVFLVLGTLAAQAAVVGAPSKGQEGDQSRVLVKGQKNPQDQVKRQYPAKGQKNPQDEVKRQYPAKGQDSYKGLTKPGSCPMVMIRCAMMNPPNACMRDTQCAGSKKCCEGSCGKACLNPQ